MKDTLYNLPCFTQIENISSITAGLSQSCFKINADNKVYFAKTISNNIELSVTVFADKAGLSPNVIYHDQHWLISNFIDAKNLALSTINTRDKINHAIQLMVQCHQLNVKPPELSPKEIIRSLLNNTHYSTLQKNSLLEFINLILVPINHSKNNVCCHGDLNFSNVLMNQIRSTWLVDYECACTAPIEYDLAMFIAVNNLARDKITIIIEQYEVQSTVNIDLQLLNHYLLFCYFINALWYFNAYHEKSLIDESKSQNKQVLLKHAQKQYDALQASLELVGSPLFSSLSSKFTNILSTFDFSNQT